MIDEKEMESIDDEEQYESHTKIEEVKGTSTDSMVASNDSKNDQPLLPIIQMIIVLGV